MGILGRRRTPKLVAVNTDDVELLQRQLNSSDPALRLIATEVQTLVSPCKNSAPDTGQLFPADRASKGQRNPRVQGPPNPDPKRLLWDLERRGFGLINPTCNGDHGRSALSGEKLTCGLCDGQAARPKRSQPGSTWPACRYCGRSADSWSSLICARCDQTRSKIEIGAVARFSLADRRGRTGPPTVGDDELLVMLIRRMRDADHNKLSLDAKDARRAKRERKARSWGSRSGGGGKGQYNPQKPSPPGAGVTPDFQEAAE
jgi:hypothetical protein